MYCFLPSSIAPELIRKKKHGKKKTDSFIDNYDPALIIEGRRSRG